ncbi:MAG: hypothetical protein LBV60_26730 [Streptomyces sp.]|nr:hypothetical protein [Streptomyces sp.]
MTIIPAENGVFATESPALWPPLTTKACSVDFSIGPEIAPVEAMERAVAMVRFAVPRFFAEPDGETAVNVSERAEAVLRELVDVTARHKRPETYLTGRVEYDGSHVTISVGDMARSLPGPEEEPGLYLVYGMASEVGQYAGDHGGRVTWAAVPA